VAHSEVLNCTSRGRCRLSDPNAVLRRIIGFCAAGLRQSA
jgi:hypothetical protein